MQLLPLLLLPLLSMEVLPLLLLPLLSMEVLRLLLLAHLQPMLLMLVLPLLHLLCMLLLLLPPGKRTTMIAKLPKYFINLDIQFLRSKTQDNQIIPSSNKCSLILHEGSTKTQNTPLVSHGTVKYINDPYQDSVVKRKNYHIGPSGQFVCILSSAVIDHQYIYF